MVEGKDGVEIPGEFCLINENNGIDPRVEINSERPKELKIGMSKTHENIKRAVHMREVRQSLSTSDEASPKHRCAKHHAAKYINLFNNEWIRRKLQPK